MQILKSTTFTRRSLWAASFDSPALRRLLASLCADSVPGDALMLKAGDTTTVYQVPCAGRQLVVKRYNLKNWRYALKRALLPSRAQKSWANAGLLRQLGLPTPPPVAWVEERWGLLRRTSYFLYEHQDGVDAASYFLTLPEGWQQQAEVISHCLQQLAVHQLRHGDLKATNLLLTAPGVVLLDLDALRRCRFQPRRCAMRDRARWLENWQDHPELHATFTRLWPSH